jgi:drug/metabolite transporter (DMT)-like permease
LHPSRAVLAAFTGFVLIGGVNFVGVRFSNAELPPLMGASVRFGGAAALLFLFIAARARFFVGQAALPRGRALLGAFLYGLLGFGAGYGFAYTALTTLPASAGAVVFASYPLFTALLAPLHGIERFRLRGLIGATLALVGIVILTDPGSAQGLPLVPVLTMVASTIAAAESGVLVKRFPAVAPEMANAIGMGAGATVLVALSLGMGETWNFSVTSSTWWWVVYLAVVGSAGMFGLFLYVLHRWTATATSYATALLPVSAILAGAVIGNEVITVNVVVGAVLVVLATYVGALAPSPAVVDHRA